MLVALLTATFALGLLNVSTAIGQAVPYARSFSQTREELDFVLKELQAYAGQKLPIVDGFVALPDQPLERYERAFYQFSIELAPGASGGSVVSVAAKITAWYVDRDPSKSGYHVLPSNGRLELDLLDRLSDKLNGKPSILDSHSRVQAPRPKLDLSAAATGTSLPTRRSESLPPEVASSAGEDELAALRIKREAQQKRMQQLNAELQSLQDIQHNQAHPSNLGVVKKSGAAVLAKPAGGSRVLFTAAPDDEFEFLDARDEWIHVQISGASRGYIRRSNLELPELLAARLKSPNITSLEEKQEAFRVVREETGTFPGDWELLRGKSVRIYTVQPASQELKQTAAAAKLSFAASLIRKFSASAASVEGVEGVVIVFDSADGGIIATTVSSANRLADASLSGDAFWKQCYVDVPNALH